MNTTATHTHQRVSRFPWLLWTLVSVSLLPTSVIAQSDTSEAKDTPTAVTTDEPTISVEHLELMLTPLTTEELQAEANAWRELLKAKLVEIAEARIALEDAADSDGQPEEDAEALAELQEERQELIDRLTLVVDELEAKGGGEDEVQAYRQYISAVSGVDVPVSDVSTTVAVLREWFSSDQGGRRWFWNILKFLAILLAFYFGASIAAGLARNASSRVKGTSQLLQNFLGKFVKQVVMILGFVVALAALEVDITPLLAAIGAAGFVIGFALQDTLSNFASGLLILLYRPFDVGHVIEAAGISGIVDSVSLFSTHVRTFDNKLMVVPNNDIWGGTITNATASETRRVDLVFGIGYDDDTEQARNILETLVKEHELVLDDPAPVVQLHELGDSSINFICRPWTKTGDYWSVYWDITRKVKQEFDRAGISIPYPQRDVHIYQESSAGNAEAQGG